MTLDSDVMPGSITSRRKNDQIDINLTQAVQARDVKTGLG